MGLRVSEESSPKLNFKTFFLKAPILLYSQAEVLKKVLQDYKINLHTSYETF